MTPEAADRHWMEQALALGALAEGATSPNPRVGCLVVRDQEVVGRGYHRAAGQPHAETSALHEAGDRARGATVYVTLEPCAHFGQTPPCAEQLVEAGVSRVFAALRDPDPRVDGRGFKRLREAGVEVDVGLLSGPAARLNAPFLHWQRHSRPRVTLKAAVSLDGMLSAAAGESRWITGSAARRFAHRLRLRHDAVLVGSGTLHRDDPRLDVRLGSTTATRRRVVLSRRLELDLDRQLWNGAGPATRVYTAEDAPSVSLPAGVEVVRVASRGDALDLAAVLSHLAADGVQSLLVEGGGKTHAAFLEQSLVDDVALFVAHRLIGARGATPLVDGDAVPEPRLAPVLTGVERIPLGRDWVLLGQLAHGD